MSLYRKSIFLGWQATILGSSFFSLFLNVSWYLESSVNPTIGYARCAF